MANSTAAIIYAAISVREDADSIKLALGVDGAQVGYADLLRILEGLPVRGGKIDASIAESDNSNGVPVRATATVTITHANVSDGDTITIGGKVLTWRAAPSGDSEMDIKADATTDAAEMVRVINANAILRACILASNVAGVATLAFCLPGVMGELITTATSDATAMALSGNLATADAETSKLGPQTYAMGM